MAVHNYDSEGITFVDGWTSIKQKNYLKVNKMNEKTKKEIADSLQYIGMTQEEAEQKYENICIENGYELTDPLGLALYRSFVMQHRRSQKRPSNSGGDSLVKKCFGFFVGLEAPRDTLAWKRRKAKEEYNRDVDNALEKGIVAVATQNALGKWTVSTYKKGEYQEKIMTNLHPGAEEGNDGQYYIPLDDTERYMNGAENKGFGRPLATEEYRRQGIFYGSIDGGENFEMVLQGPNFISMEYNVSNPNTVYAVTTGTSKFYRSNDNGLTWDNMTNDVGLPNSGNNRGIIGVTDRISKNYSRVISILNTKLNLNAKLKKSNHFGVLNWNGMSNSTIQLMDLPKQTKINIGDTIITGGNSFIFPEGILIGNVLSYKLDDTQNYIEAEIGLFNDMTSIKNVHVIKNNHLAELKKLNE